MKLIVIILFASMLSLGFILGSTLSCGSGLTGPAFASADCDTVRFTALKENYIKIFCVKTVTDTLYVDVYIEPDWACIKSVLDIKGLGHWEEAIEGCLDD